MARPPRLRWSGLLCLCFDIFHLAACAPPGHWPKVAIVNRSPISLNLNWMASNTELNHLATLEPGGFDSQDTFLGHRFKLLPVSVSEPGGCRESYCDGIIIEAVGHGTVQVTMQDDKLQATWVALSKTQVREPTQEETAAARELGQEKAKECVENLKVAEASGQDPHAVEEDAETFCNKFPTREFITSSLSMPNDTWHKQMSEGPWKSLAKANAEQPSALMNFSHSGFKLLQRHGKDGQTPYGDFFKTSFASDVDTMIGWYEENRKTARPEEHGILDPSVSSYESDTWVIRPPAELSRPIVKEVQHGLERWAGLPQDSLEFINFYGVRLYRNTSSLHRHVDIWETHVLSAIVNVGKRGLTSPWPLRIVHHDGSLHEVDDSPGDVIFYESASCPHGRDLGKLQGREGR